MQTGFVLGDRGLGAAGDTHPAWMLGHADMTAYRIVGASAVGQIHLAKKLPRDDAFLIRGIGPWLAVAVADGVGSRPLSRYGATYVVESLTSQLLRPFAALRVEPAEPRTFSALSKLVPSDQIDDMDFKPVVINNSVEPATNALKELKLTFPQWARRASQSAQATAKLSDESAYFQQVASLGWWVSATAIRDLAGTDGLDEVPSSSLASPLPDLATHMREVFNKTHQGLRSQADYLNLELPDLGCTALALLLNMETGRGVVGQIGDGALLGLTAKGRVIPLVEAPDTGDPQATYTINRPNFAKYLAVGLIDQPEVDRFVGFYAMTDGLSGDLLYGDEEELRNWARGVYQNIWTSSTAAQAATGLLNWLASYQVKGSWDDRTLVAVIRRMENNGNRQPTPR